MPAPGESVPPATFRLTGWEVFRPGLHNADLYSPADIDRIAENFARYSAGDQPFIPVVAKLGHDPEQTLAKAVNLASAGEPGIGRVVALRKTAAGGLEVDTGPLPATTEYVDADGKVRVFDLLSKVRDGLYRGASVEVPPGDPPAPPQDGPGGPWLETEAELPDPARGGLMAEGPYLTAVALLGSERPAVGGMAAAATALTFAAAPGRRLSRDLPPPPPPEPTVDRDALDQQLQAMGLDPAKYADLSDDQVKRLIADMGGDAFTAAAKKKFAADPAPAPKPGEGAGATYSAAEIDGLKRQMADQAAAVQQMAADLAGLKPAVQETQTFAASNRDLMARQRDQHEAAVKAAVRAAVKAGRLAPVLEAAMVRDGLAQSTAKTFAAGDGRTEYEVWAANLSGLPVSHLVQDAAEDGGRPSALPAGARAVVAHLQLDSGRSAKNLAGRLA